MTRWLRSCGFVVTLAFVFWTPPVEAAEISGGFRLFWSESDSDDSVSRSSERQFSLNLSQQLTPFLTVALRNRFFDLDSTTDGAETFSRRFRTPTLELLYSRPDFSARLGYVYRLADGSAERDNFEARGSDGSMSWRIRPDLSLTLAFRDDVNQADVGIFGRDTESRRARAELLYQRDYWSSSYSYSRSSVESRRSGLSSEVDRHDLRLQASRRLLDRRLSLSLSGNLARSDRRESVGAGAGLAEPVPAAAGLFALDPTPELGDLEPVPGLIDGDALTETEPRIEIGGANTLRNIGLDLGLNRPVTRLEISVDRPSGSAVRWEVYSSRDNLFWEPIPGARTDYDGDLLRYTIFFPETEDRFFKAVNVTVNPESEVAVTEIRALLDLSGFDDASSSEDNLYRLSAFASYAISPRIRGRVAFGASNDDSRLGGFLTRDRRNDFGSAGLDFDLTRSLRLVLGYRWTEEMDSRDPDFDRQTAESSVTLNWSPLPTVDAVLSSSYREETSETRSDQESLSSKLSVGLRLLPDLRLVSTLTSSQLDDPSGRFDRDSLSWSQRLDMTPLSSWRLSAGYNHLRAERPDGSQLIERTNLFLDTDWSASPYLTLTARWRFFEESVGESVRQTYGIFYRPGPKLALTANWEEFDSDAGRFTANESVTLNYRLYRQVLLSARISRSKTAMAGGGIETITSGRSGLRIGF